VRYHAEVARTVPRILCGVILATGAVSGFERSLDLPLINAATAIGESRVESVRTQYHRPYRIPVARAPIDYIDVVTPFRRIVRIAEDRARAGARPLGQRETLDAAGDRIGLVEFFVELTFHPLNTYVGVPLYEVELASALQPTAPQPTRILPVQVNRTPRFGARVAGTPPLSPNIPLNVPGANEPMLGGTVIAGFDALGLDPAGVYEVVVKEQGKELARVPVNLGSLR
jgi:hypothetical protein